MAVSRKFFPWSTKWTSLQEATLNDIRTIDDNEFIAKKDPEQFVSVSLQAEISTSPSTLFPKVSNVRLLFIRENKMSALGCSLRVANQSTRQAHQSPICCFAS